MNWNAISKPTAVWNKRFNNKMVGISLTLDATTYIENMQMR